MKRIILLSAIIGASMCFAGTAVLADEITSLRMNNLPEDGAIVTISGAVDQVQSDREFTLHNSNGTITVKITTPESMVLKNGDKVIVTGAVDTGFLGLMDKSIDATSVQVQKDLGAAISDTVTKATGLSVDEAKTAQIAKLPNQGMVKVTGTVDTVADTKKFTLKDSTGTVDVNIQSDENIVLTKGSGVTVIGYVNNGVLGKTIRATHVMVSANTQMPRAGIIVIGDNIGLSF